MVVNMTNSREKVTTVLPATFESMRPILKFVTTHAADANLDADAVYQCKLAVDEAATNIIEHAYEGGSGDITIEILKEDGACEIQLIDTGKAFDPAHVPSPKIGAPLEQRQPGGLGIFLMHRVMDEVRYLPGPPYNRLILVKRQ